MDARCFRTTVAGGSGRVLQPAGLWFQPKGEWLGRNDGHRTAAQPSVFVERKAVSREGPWRTLRRNRTKCLVQRRSAIGEHASARVELGWGLGAVEIPAREHMGVQCGVWDGSSIGQGSVIFPVCAGLRGSDAGATYRRRCY